MSLKLNINALSALAGINTENDEFSDLSDVAAFFPQDGVLTTAIAAELDRKRNETVQKAAAEIVQLLQSTQAYINEEVENLREIRRQGKIKTAILRDLKARMEFAAATNNYIVLAHSMGELKNYDGGERQVIDEAEKAYQAWRLNKAAAAKTESNAKETTPAK